VFSVSSYCNCYECTNKHPGDPAYGITTSGTVAKRGTIAAPKGIPFGTRIYIPGVGVCVVEDRGGAIRGNRLDVWRNSHAEALRFGRQELLCEILLDAPAARR
jgi:3D (Asp-Asp-Asp) domain-containing protein